MSNRTTKGTYKKTSDLPEIPEKLYFTIGEVGSLCHLYPHVLRYWEQEFPQLRPVKRRGNRRYYQKKDVLLVRQIRELLYDNGYTIEGARQQLMQPVNRGKKAPSNEKQGLSNAIGALEALLLELETA